MKYILWLTLLLAAGCSQEKVRDSASVDDGLKVTCDWCVGLEVMDVEEMDVEGQHDTKDIVSPEHMIKP